jgi:hypothetical protein
MKIRHFAKNKSLTRWRRKLPKKKHHILKKKNYEIAKDFREFGQISSFLLLK